MTSNALLEEAAELNNQGVMCLLRTSTCSHPANQAIPLLKSSLAILQQHLLDHELQPDPVHADTNFCTPLMVSIPVVQEDSDCNHLFHLYNRCFVLDSTNGLNFKSVVAVIFNLSLACHTQGRIHNARALYNMTWALVQDSISQQDSMKVLLELAIKNNLAHCHLLEDNDKDKDKALELMESMSNTLLVAHGLAINPLLSLEVDHLQEITVNFYTVHSFPIVTASAA